MKRPAPLVTISAGALVMCAAALVAAQPQGTATPPIPEPAPTLQTPSPEALAQRFPEDTREVLEAAPQLILYTIEPRYFEVYERNGKRGEVNEELRNRGIAVQRYRMLGKATLVGAEKRLALDALYDARSGLPPGIYEPAGLCYYPRHAIRAVDPKTHKRVDLLLCFGCHSGKIYWGVGKEKEDQHHSFDTFGPATEYYWELLRRKHELPLAP